MIGARLTAFVIFVSNPVLIAQAQENTKIQMHFELSIERLTPNPVPRGSVANDVTIVLSGRNDIHEVYDESANAGRLSRHGDSAQTLGSSHWHVIGPHKLERIYRERNNIDSIVVDVQGDRCSAVWKSTLLPGFDVYTFKSMTTHQVESYAKPWMISSTCSIEKLANY